MRVHVCVPLRASVFVCSLPSGAGRGIRRVHLIVSLYPLLTIAIVIGISKTTYRAVASDTLKELY